MNVKECEDCASSVVVEVAQQKEREEVKAKQCEYLNSIRSDDLNELTIGQ